MPSALSGKTVVFTGGLKTKRADATNKATALGASVTGSISGNTDIVVAGPGAGTKLAQAQARGCEVWDEQKFLDCVAAGAGGRKKASAKKEKEPAAKKEKPQPKPAKKATTKQKREEEDKEEEAPKAKKPRGKAAAKKEEPKEAPATPTKSSAPAPAPATPFSPAGGRKFPVDRLVPNREDRRVYDVYSCKLNQTNIGGNNNKFYIIQVLEQSGGGQYWTWNRWGRIGEPGQNKLEPHSGNRDSAIKAFESKFKDKTRNAWGARDNFKPVDGKYTLLDMDEEEGGGAEAAPLGKLSEQQIKKGMEVLEEIEAEIDGSGSHAKLIALSSRFYTLIPTEFGRKVPEPIKTEEKRAEKEELLKFWLRMGFEECGEDDSGLTPIEGVMNLAIPATLAASVSGTGCGLGSVHSSDKRGEALEKKQAGKPAKHVPAKYYGAIMLYTSNAIYAALNKALREENRNNVKKYFNYLRLLLEALGSLPQNTVTLYRGIPADLHDQYQVGSTQTWWNVSSCTSDLKVAKSFMQGCGGHCSLLTVKAKTSTDISALSFYANEKESLLAPGTQLKVESCKRSGKVTEITLVETGRLLH